MESREKSRLRRAIEQVLLLALVVVIFWLIFRRVKISDVLAALKSVEPVRFFALSFLFVCATVLLDSYTHFILFRGFDFGFSFAQMLKLRLANLLFSSLGFIYGQGGMVWMAGRDSQKPPTRIVGILAFLFFNSFHAALFWVTLGMAVLLPWANVPNQFRWLWVWIAIDWPLYFAWVLFWQSRFKNRVPASLRASLLYGFDHAGPLLYLKMFLLRAAQFLVIAVFIWMAMPAMHIQVPFRVVMSLLPIQGIIIAIPTLGKYGVNEGAFLLLFKPWAAGSSLVAFALLWGTSSNILRVLASLFGLRRSAK